MKKCGIFVVAILVGWLMYSSPAMAVLMSCAWDTDTVDVWINPTNLCTGSWCHDEDEVILQLKDAINAWNYSGADFNYKYAGSSTTKTEVSGDEILIVFDDDPDEFCRLGHTGYPDNTYCLADIIVVNMEIDNPSCSIDGVIDWRTSYTTSEFTEPVFSAVFVHEMGHRVGLWDDTSTPRSTVMNGWGGNANYARYLWPDDKEALRNHASYGYGMRTDSNLYMKDSSNGTTWTSATAPSDNTIYTPGLVWGNSKFVLVYVEANDGLDVMSRTATTGSWSSAYNTGVDSYNGVDVAYGDGKYVMVYTDTTDNRYLKVVWSTNGTSWTGGPEYVRESRSVSSYVRPTIVYNSRGGKFHVAYAAVGNSDLCTFTADESDLSDWERECGNNDDETSVTGPGLVCNDSGYCTYGWATSSDAECTGFSGTGTYSSGVLTIVSGNDFDDEYTNANYSAAFDLDDRYLLIGKSRGRGPGTDSGRLFRMYKSSYSADWANYGNMFYLAHYGADVTWNSSADKFRIVYSY